MKKTVKLYGETFEVKYPKNGVEFRAPSMWDYTDIYQAYERPSIYKVQIWEYWKNFGLPEDETQPYRVGIPWIDSRNCFMFTVTADIYDGETGEFAGIMHITKDHNYLYLNKED